MAVPPAALFPPMHMPPLPIRSPSPPPHFPIPGPHDSLRRLPNPLPDFDFDWTLPTRAPPPGPRRLPRPFSWTAEDDETIKFHARQNSSVASTPTAPSPSHSRWPSSAGFSSTSSTAASPTEHDRPAAPSDWVSGADSSPPRRKSYYHPLHQPPRSPDTMGPTSPYPEPPSTAQSSFLAPSIVVDEAPRGTGGAKERAARKRAERGGISDIILEIDAALDRIGGPRAAALKCPSPLPSPGTPIRAEFGSRFRVRQESPLRHGRSVTMPEGLGGGKGDDGNSGGGEWGLRPTSPTPQFMSREPHSPTSSSAFNCKQRCNPPTLGPSRMTSRARYRPVSEYVVAKASTVAAPKTTFPLPAAALAAQGARPTANTSIIRTAVAPDPLTALHSNPPSKRSTMPPGALLSSGGTTRSISSGTTLVSNASSGNANGRSVSSPLGNISIAAAASSSTPALYCPPDAPPVPPVHRIDPLSTARPSNHNNRNHSHSRSHSRSRPRAFSTSSSSPSPSRSPYAAALASTSASPSSLTSAPYSFTPSASGSPSSRSSSISCSSSSSSSSQRDRRGRRLRRKFSPRRGSLRELRDRHSDACLKQAFEWGVKRYLEGTIFWDGKEADLFLGPEEDGDTSLDVLPTELAEAECDDGDAVWQDCREWAESGAWERKPYAAPLPPPAKDLGVGVALGGEDFFERGRARRSVGVSSINVEVGQAERGWAEEVLGAAMG